MSKDFFQDITPPSGEEPPRVIRPSQPPEELDAAASDDTESEEKAESIPIHVQQSAAPLRGIRNIPASRPRVMRPGGIGSDMRAGGPAVMPPKPKQPRSRWWLWGVVALCVLILLGLALVALRSTTVTVTPVSHTVVFSNTSTVTAYPTATAGTGALTYTVGQVELEDSQVVPSQGTVTTPPTKASGEITVYNNYSTSKVDFVKDTRFSTPDGLIFRTPEAVVVPGKKGTTPGQVTITVVADQPGANYNIAPVSRFTVPGLQSNAAMYAGVYAKSTAAMSGGASGGTGPAIAPADLAKAQTDLRSSLSSQAEDALAAKTSSSTITFPELIQISYTDEPNTTEAGSGVRVHEKIDASAPVFPAVLFAQTVAQWVSADAQNASLTLTPGSGFSIAMASSTALGQDPIDLTLSGQALLVWNVDAGALAQALAGHPQSAFEGIVNSFPGVQEAHARVEPFWSSTFPSNPSDIKVVVTAPQTAQ